MAILPIYTFDHPVLKRKTAAIDDMDDALAELIENMFVTMENADGIGLAANQVGISRSLTVIDVALINDEEDDGDGKTPEDRKKKKDAARAAEAEKSDAEEAETPARKKIALINPEIVDLSGGDVDYVEGCLSLPELTGTVIRPEQVTVRYLDGDMKEQELTANGLLARVIQHEVDHLHGIYFFERMTPLRKARLHNKLKRIARGMTPAAYPLYEGNSKKRRII